MGFGKKINRNSFSSNDIKKDKKKMKINMILTKHLIVSRAPSIILDYIIFNSEAEFKIQSYFNISAQNSSVQKSNLKKE